MTSEERKKQIAQDTLEAACNVIAENCEQPEEVEHVVLMLTTVSLKMLKGIKGQDYFEDFVQAAIEDPECVAIQANYIN